MPPSQAGRGCYILRTLYSRLWTPAQDGWASLCLWLDASDLNTIIFGTGTGVFVWVDKSQYGNNVDQITAAKQPPLVTAAGANSLSFNGTSQVLVGFSNTGALSTLGFPFSTAPRSFFAVVNPSATIAAGSIMQYGNGAPTGQNGNGFMVLMNAANDRWISTNNFDLKTVAAISAVQQLYSSSSASGTTTIYKNGTSAISGTLTMTTTSSAALHVGGAFWNALNQNYFKGNISEILFTNALLSRAQAQVYEGYLAWKWGLAKSLPTTHAYAFSPPTVGA